jgi:hypothetical protein
MSRCVRVFRAKGRAKGVYVTKGKGIHLSLELSADREIGCLAKKIIAEVDFSVPGGKALEIKRGNGEHIASTLAIAPGNNRGVQIDETFPVKIVMDSKADSIPDASYSPKGVGARSQMGYGSQIFEGMPLFLQRVCFRISPSQDLNLFGLYLKVLSLARRFNHGTGNHNGATGRQSQDLVRVIG